MKKTKIIVFVCMVLSFTSCRKEEVPMGGIDGKFSVSELRKVYFSKGNLQYQAATRIWRFAEQQYELIGESNANISETYDGWIDLFAWSSSGCVSGGHICQPWSVSLTSSDYYPLGVHNNNLSLKNGADWGCNAISNGENKKYYWYTLSFEEWLYLLNERENAAQKRGFGTVAGIRGFILLPDEWKQPAGLLFNTESTNYYDNVYSVKEWPIMEAAGAVFLPAAGWREVYSVEQIDRVGSYWTSSCYKVNQAFNFVFSPSAFLVDNTNLRGAGFSVRLAREAD